MHTLRLLAILPVLLMGFALVAADGPAPAREASEPGASPESNPDSPRIIRTYAPDTTDFPNPDRGFYRQWAPFYVNSERTPLRTVGLASLRPLGMSVVRAYYVIDEFRGAPLSPAALAAMADDLAAIREAGLRVIPRFAYNFGCGGQPEPCHFTNAVDAPLDRVLGHIDQLTPLLQTNADVIAFVEVGFVGAWGEWHSSSNNLVNANGTVNASSAAITNRLLAALPARRMVALRYPYHKQALFGAAPLDAAEAFSGSARARVGAHNDCVFANQSDGGTYSTPYPPFGTNPELFKQYLNAENRFLPQGGESCASDPPAQPYIQCANALADLARVRWSTINLDYHQDVIQLWRTQGCFAEISRRLGYRFRLIDADLPAHVAIGGTLTARLTIANDGWAAPYNPRALELVLRNRVSGRLYRVPIGSDPRFWSAGTTTVVPVSAAMPQGLEPGTYSVLLNLPDPESGLNHRPEYSIRLANANVWEPATGFNSLQADIVAIDNPAPTNLAVASIAGNTLTIGWAAPEILPDSYVLEGGLQPGTVLASVPIAAGASSFSTAVPTGAYYIRLHALRSSTRSAASNEVRIFVNVPPPPNAPANLLGLVNGSALHLAWRHQPGPAATGIVLDVTGAIATSITLPMTDSFAYASVPPGTYTMAVRATNAAGTSTPSNTVTLTFPGPCTGVPAAPAAPAATRSGNAVTVSWNPPAIGPAPSSYTLVVHGAFEGAFPTTGRALSGAVAPGSYTLSVAASNACGTGAESAGITITVP